MFDPKDFLGNKLNAEYLQSLPTPAVKGIITGGGVANFKDGTKSPFLKLTSSSGQWEGEKEMMLNKTNLNILKAGLGQQPAGWISKEIGVFFDPTVTYGGKVTGGIKVKVIVPDPFATAAPPPPAPSTVDLQEVPF
jgi:hypothetical protein